MLRRMLWRSVSRRCKERVLVAYHLEERVSESVTRKREDILAISVFDISILLLAFE